MLWRQSQTKVRFQEQRNCSWPYPTMATDDNYHNHYYAAEEKAYCSPCIVEHKSFKPDKMIQKMTPDPVFNHLIASLLS